MAPRTTKIASNLLGSRPPCGDAPSGRNSIAKTRRESLGRIPFSRWDGESLYLSGLTARMTGQGARRDERHRVTGFPRTSDPSQHSFLVTRSEARAILEW